MCWTVTPLARCYNNISLVAVDSNPMDPSTQKALHRYAVHQPVCRGKDHDVVNVAALSPYALDQPDIGSMV